MNRRRLVLLAATGVVLAGCVDRISAPNTDVGLTVWAGVVPATVRMRDSTLPIHFQVYVGNRSTEEIRVTSGGPPYVFTSDPARSQGLWGSVRIGTDASPLNAGPNTDWWGQPVYVFAPRHAVHDDATFTLNQWKRGGWPVKPGRYRVRGWFNGREGREATLTILP